MSRRDLPWHAHSKRTEIITAYNKANIQVCYPIAQPILLVLLKLTYASCYRIFQ